MKRQCRKAEWMWRKTKLEIHYNIYKDSLHAFNVELATARQNFFSNLINSNLNNTHTLFATAEWLTTPQVRFPVKCSPRANAMSLLPSFLRRSIISERRLAHSLSYAEVTQIWPQFQKEVTAVTKSYYHLKNIAIIISFVCSHWLPVTFRIDFKVLLRVYKSLNGLGPKYIVNMLAEYKPNRPLRSVGSSQLWIPRVHTKQGKSAFRYFAARSWNQHPEEIRCAKILATFKSRLKTQMFSCAFVEWALCYIRTDCTMYNHFLFLTVLKSFKHFFLYHLVSIVFLFLFLLNSVFLL